MARLVVLGDSLAFHGPHGPVPLAEPRLYPNRLVAALPGDWDAVVVARAGWSLREVWVALQKEVHLQQQVLMGAGAVVLGVGSIDPLPVGVPRPLQVSLPYLRPTRLRRRVRRALDRVHPRLVRLTGARLRYTPPSVHAHCLGKSIDAIRFFTGGAPLVAVLPGVHAGPYYAGRNPARDAYAARTAAIARDRGLPVVDLAALTEPWLHALNPDGLHWPWALHTAVAAALAAALHPQFGAAPA